MKKGLCKSFGSSFTTLQHCATSDINVMILAPIIIKAENAHRNFLSAFKDLFTFSRN